MVAGRTWSGPQWAGAPGPGRARLDDLLAQRLGLVDDRLLGRGGRALALAHGREDAVRLEALRGSGSRTCGG